MPIQTLPDLLAAIQQAQLLEPAQLQEVRRSFAKPNTDSRLLAKLLIQQGWLTPFQVNQVFQGHGKSLVLGSYLLLERLGEGGMGEVYKARHREMHRVVALKLIRKNLLNNPHAVERFHREVRAVAQLNHPNIVRAYDASHVGDTQFLVMEYVAGIDLSKRVKRQGPLRVDAACDYIRQASLGLQHAHERGLIHRDIKPSNLLLTPDPAPGHPWGTITLLDLGLARIADLNRDGNGEPLGNTLTDSAHVVGTPDFVAPEQARHSHSIDCRADLYSLGCTFYFLLTAKVPFPADTLTEKLIKHTLEEAPSVQQLRPEVPVEISRLVHTLMAKQPEERIQSAGELAQVIANGLRSGAWTAPGTRSRLQRLFHIGQPAGSETLSLPVSARTPDLKGHQPPRPRSRSRLLLLGAVSVLGFALLGWLFLGLFRTNDARSATSTPSPATKQAVPGKDSTWLATVRKLPAEEQVKAVARRLVELNPRFHGKMAHEIENGVVTEVRLLTDDVTDLAPLQAFSGLKVLQCTGSYEQKSKLADLSFVKGMPLRELVCSGTEVANLSPLGGMNLLALDCSDTPVADLLPLRGMPLRTLNCNATRVADLTPLRGMSLQKLWCKATPVRDLVPLQGMPLTTLHCNGTQVSDLSPLRGMPLKSLVCDFRADRDAAILGSIKTLEKINEKPAHEVLR